MQGLWLSMGRIDEVWMCRAEVSGELVQSVVSDKHTGRDVQHAVFSIEVLNGGAAAGRVTFAKDFLKVAVQKLNNSIILVLFLVSCVGHQQRSLPHVISVSCPLWVISRHWQCKTACPLYPQKRTRAVPTNLTRDISCSVANIPFLLYTFVAVDFNARSYVKPCSKVDY
jgi:hypothetical protein